MPHRQYPSSLGTALFSCPFEPERRDLLVPGRLLRLDLRDGLRSSLSLVRAHCEQRSLRWAQSSSRREAAS